LPFGAENIAQSAPVALEKSLAIKKTLPQAAESIFAIIPRLFKQQTAGWIMSITSHAKNCAAAVLLAPIINNNQLCAQPPIYSSPQI